MSLQQPLALFIGKRYAAIRSRNLLVGFISRLSILGLCLGVAILITVLSVMNGFDRELRTRILALAPHMTMTSARNEFLQDSASWAAIQERLGNVSGIAGTAPFLQVQGMLLANGNSRGIILNGIDPGQESRVSIIGDFVGEEAFTGLTDRSYSLLIGAELAENLQVGIGDTVNLVSTVVPITPLGEFVRQKQFIIGGIFNVGSQLDSRLAIANLGDVQRVYRLGDTIHGLRIQLDDLFAVGEVGFRISSEVTDNFQISNWTRDYGNIYENIRLSKSLVGLLLSLLVAVAAFNVVVSLVMVVKEKQGDIAILRTMGTSLASIRHIFMVQGFYIGLAGTLAGLLLGIFFALTISDIVSWLEQALDMQFLSADIYPVNYLPSQLQVQDLLLVCGVALGLTILATLLPARAAARTDPAEVLRYE